MADINAKLKFNGNTIYPQTKVGNIINDDGTPWTPSTSGDSSVITIEQSLNLSFTENTFSVTSEQAEQIKTGNVATIIINSDGTYYYFNKVIDASYCSSGLLTDIGLSIYLSLRLDGTTVTYKQELLPFILDLDDFSVTAQLGSFSISDQVSNFLSLGTCIGCQFTLLQRKVVVYKFLNTEGQLLYASDLHSNTVSGSVISYGGFYLEVNGTTCTLTASSLPSVVPNPSAGGTSTLTKLQIGQTVYAIGGGSSGFVNYTGTVSVEEGNNKITLSDGNFDANFKMTAVGGQISYSDGTDTWIIMLDSNNLLSDYGGADKLQQGNFPCNTVFKLVGEQLEYQSTIKYMAVITLSLETNTAVLRLVNSATQQPITIASFTEEQNTLYIRGFI